MSGTEQSEIARDDPFAPTRLEEINEHCEHVGQIPGECECGAGRPMVIAWGCELYKECCGRPVYA